MKEEAFKDFVPLASPRVHTGGHKQGVFDKIRGTNPDDRCTAACKMQNRFYFKTLCKKMR